jgi:glycosyltransferase involved in cell wall biosynthesis
LKILHLIDSGGLYGAEKMLLSLVQEQVNQGLEPMILSVGEPDFGEKPIEKEAQKRGVSVTPWRMKPGLNLMESWKILKWAQGRDYDLLHSHGFKFNVLVGLFPTYFRKLPVIATLHGYVHAKRLSKMWLYECLDRIAIKHLDGVVLVGQAMRSELPEKLSNGQTAVIPNGLNISGLQEASLQPLEEPFNSFVHNHDIVILGVGRLSREKGFDRLILAFHDLKKREPQAGLIIVGEGGLRQYFEKLVDDLDLKDDVLLPGYCGAVPSLMRRSTLLVMPSLTEGLPITLLEAMSLRTPIVASAVGEIPKVLWNGQGGEVISKIDPGNILQAMEDSIADKSRTEERAAFSYENVSKTYSSEAMAGGYLEFYNQVLMGKHSTKL